MTVLFEKISEFSTKRVDFYTVYLGGSDITEFELFLDKDFPEHSEEIEVMFNAIELMQSRGAKKFYFVEEQNANAMPVVTSEIKDANKEDYGIRLYCIRLTDDVVVLLNGGIKTNIKPELCENVKKHFERAIKIARILDKLRYNNEINFQTIDCLQGLEIEI